MKMPGFSAEASLHRASNHYKMFGSTHHSGDTIVVVPQVWIGLTRRGSSSIPSCVCRQAEGCPCCESIFDVGFPRPWTLDHMWPALG